MINICVEFMSTSYLLCMVILLFFEYKVIYSMDQNPPWNINSDLSRNFLTIETESLLKCSFGISSFKSSYSPTRDHDIYTVLPN